MLRQEIRKKKKKMAILLSGTILRLRPDDDGDGSVALREPVVGLLDAVRAAGREQKGEEEGGRKREKPAFQREDI